MSNELVELSGEALKLVGAGWTIQKLLGPTLDYFGESIEGVAKKRIENVNRILRNAAKKLGNPDDLDQGQVSPRIVKDILQEGSYFDDELAAEYFGGILAADRRAAGTDDGAAYWTQLLARLPSRAIRTHYVLYRAAQRCLARTEINFASSPPSGGESRVYVPWSTYASALELPEALSSPEWDLWAEDMYVLEQYLLLGDKDHGGWMLGPQSSISKDFPKAPEAGAIFKPTFTGVKLFMMAHGVTEGNRAFTQESERFQFEADIPDSGSYCCAAALLGDS